MENNRSSSSGRTRLIVSLLALALTLPAVKAGIPVPSVGGLFAD